jgi:hypothetical protein
MNENTETKVERKPLVLAKGVENTLPNSSMARAKKGTQRHVIAGDETRTLCGIDTTKCPRRSTSRTRLSTARSAPRR